MEVIYDNAPGGAKRVLLIMLPGATDRPQDFVEWGFIRALRERNLAVDVAAVDAHMDYYFEQTIVERLHQDIVTLARAQGYEQIWLLGISLGGMGCLRYLREHAADIDGAVLLAPFLGSRGTIAEVTGAGGFQHWVPNSKADDDERVFLAWLQAYPFDVPELPKIYLGYGAEDRFAPASKLLAALLPPSNVAVIPGGHDWRTWLALWVNLQDRKFFTNDDAP
jgi:pimeloyl-ACP methyl ester carboxylesterase